MAIIKKVNQPSFKPLVYFVCFGERYKNLLNKCLYSLFKVGGYDGDVAILSHFRKEDFFQHDKIKVLNIKTDNDNITYYRNAKPRIYEYINLLEYSYIVYLDCDILINSNRFNSLISSWSSNDKLMIQRDIISIGRNKPYCGSEVLSCEERTKYSNYAFNAGIIAAKSEFFLELCKKWNEKNKEYNYTKDDQGNLVFTIVRNYIDKIQYTNDTTITNRKNDEKRNETILHFLTKSEGAFYSYFDKYIKL